MVLAALRHAEADVLQKYAAVDAQKSVDRQVSSTDADVTQLVRARQAISEESRQLVSTALQQAHDRHLQHLQSTLDRHCAISPLQASHVAIGMYPCRTD